uniref:TRAM domain-containing protein n=1 Tax=Arcella intermedia TaxID=1963864 RepID=A0A6B2L0Y0_9EUKA
MRKAWGTTQAEIVFETEEAMAAAKSKLEGKYVGNQRIWVTDKKANIPKAPINLPNQELPDIKDVITPWHNVPYETQLQRKSEKIGAIVKQIVTNLQKEPKNTWANKVPKFLGIVRSPVETGYRNKTEFTIGYSEDKKPLVGFLLGAAKDGILAVGDPSQVPVVPPEHLIIKNAIQPYIEKSELVPYQKVTHTGFWRLVILRSNRARQHLCTIQVNPVDVAEETITKIQNDLIEIAQNIKTEDGTNLIAGLFIQFHSGVSNAAPHDCPFKKLWGEDIIHEDLLGLKFQISPASFFQVNTAATEVLFSAVGDWCKGVHARSTILDICCGTGTIGLTLAKKVGKVYGFELVETAVKDARKNATINNISNCEFIAGPAENSLPKALKNVQTNLPIIGIVDPPRNGLHAKTIQAIRACPEIETLIYVSCNPDSLVNNAERLCHYTSNTYQGEPFVLVAAQAYDLFPQTHHVETLAFFRRVSKLDLPLPFSIESETSLTDESQGDKKIESDENQGDKKIESDENQGDMKIESDIKKEEGTDAGAESMKND